MAVKKLSSVYLPNGCPSLSVHGFPVFLAIVTPNISLVATIMNKAVPIARWTTAHGILIMVTIVRMPLII
jgi:hypothetical protein